MNALTTIIVTSFAQYIASGQVVDFDSAVAEVEHFLEIIEKTKGGEPLSSKEPTEDELKVAAEQSFANMAELQPCLKELVAAIKKIRPKAGFVLLIGSSKDDLGTSICSSLTNPNDLLRVLRGAVKTLDPDSN